ncbi:MAG TPA: alpha/beta hydrolase [Ktedonobacteraceae bacterium]|nr:alpha/beta hydrolase [Ktedonobacteraceae bacterium]
MSASTQVMPFVDEATFHEDVQYIESLWQRREVGGVDMQVIDIDIGIGGGQRDDMPLVFVPILEHLEFVYARQIRHFSQSRRVLMYRRHEARSRFVSLPERAEELRRTLDSLNAERADFVAHGDAAMVLFEFAARYPQRCRSLTIIAQAADYQIAPHPFIWLLHELYVRLPVERIVPARVIRNTVVNYITHSEAVQNNGDTQEQVTRLPRSLIEEQFRKIELWPRVYKFSVLPVIHYFDMRNRLVDLNMPILLINRADDILSPEAKTRWLASHLQNCAGYHVLAGGDRFFMYAQDQQVTPLIEAFLGNQV